MITVTGATGLLGSHLLVRLLQDKIKIRALIRPGTDPSKIIPVWKYYLPDVESAFRQVEWYTCDLLNRASLTEALKESEKVFHCAARVSFDQRKKKAIWNANVTITRYLVDGCLELNIGKLIHVSSVAAIGKPQQDVLTDETCGWPVKPTSIYAKTKTLGELEVWRGIHEGLKAVIVNPSIILGAGNWKSGSSVIFDTLFRGLKFYPGGAAGFVDVRDVAEIMVMLGESPITGERFILNSANLSYGELFEKIALEFGNKPPKYPITPLITSLAWKLEWLLTLFTGKEPRITRQTAHSAHSMQAYSSEKICNTLGFSFRDIGETIKHITQCYTSHIN